jgi:hypothetical protein
MACMICGAGSGFPCSHWPKRPKEVFLRGDSSKRRISGLSDEVDRLVEEHVKMGETIEHIDVLVH